MVSRKILLAEDDRIIAEDLRETLESLGHHVAALVHSGDDAVDTAREAEPELALLDIRMPGSRDGIEAGRWIRDELEIPVLFLSAYADRNTLERAKASNALGYLIKPVDHRELHTAIELASHRHTLERRLRERKEEYEATLRSLGEGVVAVDLEGRVTFMNPAAEELTGVSVDGAVGRPVSVVVRIRDGETGEKVPSPLSRALRSEGSAEFPDNALLFRADGSWIPVQDGAYPIRLEDGALVGGVMVLRDMRGARDARKRLSRSQERYHTLFRGSPVPVHVSTLQGGRIVDVNRAFCDRFGYQRKEVVGQPVDETGLWLEISSRERLVHTVQTDGEVRDFQASLRARDGSIRSVELFAGVVELEGEPCVLVLTHDVTERQVLRAELERMALYDAVTELPNRNLLRDRLQHALERTRRGESGLAVLFMDIDRFKVVNDTFGHAEGDRILGQVARRIQGCFRGQDTVARLGGDEFVVILESVEGAEDATDAAERIDDVMSRPFLVDETPVHLGASVGIALSEDGRTTAEDLLRRSDAAMYRAKQEGGQRYRVFDAFQDAGDTDRLDLENELRRAIESDRIRLWFQPTVNLRTGEITGAEALVRWEHSEKGVLLPEDFLPLAQETGLIAPLGSSVLNGACRHLAEWRSRLQDPDRFRVSVNVSVGQIARDELPSGIEEILARWQLPPGTLELELTETTLMQEMGWVRSARELGLRIAIDDFGVGYSSLGYLKEFDADTVKIPRSFVSGLGRDEEDAVIVRAILLVAEGLGMDVVAEGIETRSQLQRLVDFGCPVGQGFYFAEVLPPDRFEALLEERGQLR